MSLRILITDAQERSMLAVTRSLHQGGYLVSAAAHGRPAAAQWSRACSERLRVPDPLRDAERFVNSLEQVLGSGEYAVLLAGSDASMLAVSHNRDRLEKAVRIGLPPHEVVKRSLDKLVLAEVAASAGLPCPRTILCSGYQEAAAASRELGFPVVLKPKRSVLGSEGSMREQSSALAWDDASLAQMVSRYGNPCLVQQAEKGPIFSCAGVMADDRLLAFATSRYRRTWPPDGGSVSFSETVSPASELQTRIQGLLSSLGWQGMFEVELVMRSNGTFSALDLNPRPYGSLALAVKAGAPLPVVWCDWLLGRNPSPVSARPGLKYRWEDADARHFWWQLRRGRLRSALAVLPPHRKVVHAFFRVRDPAPLLARLLYGMRRSLASRRARRGHRPLPNGGNRPTTPAPASLPESTKPRVWAAPGNDSAAGSSSTCAVAIVGAGPYGLSAASHLRHAGVEARVFGEPMEFWRKQMPRGMVLRSRRRSSHIADPLGALTVDDYGSVSGGKLSTLSLAEFLEYGHWFQEQAAPDIDLRKVDRIDSVPTGYRLTLQDGDVVSAERVVVAAGLLPFAWRPEMFDSLPSSLVSHSSEHDDLAKFGDRTVIVIGSGQSALESAALLHEAGARVEVLARAPSIVWLQEPKEQLTLNQRMLPPTDLGGRVTGWIAAVPPAFRRMPGSLRPTIAYRCIRPAGAGWLIPRLNGVEITTQRVVTSVEHAGEKVQVKLDDGTERVVDHVLLGTGYRVNVSRYPFLSGDLAGGLDLVNGYPRLGPGLESSLPGLHFLGAPAAMSFGPIMRFVVGTWYAAPALTRRVLGKRQRAFETSLPARPKAR